MPQTVIAYGSLAPRQSLELTTQVPGEIVWVHDALVPGSELAQDEVLFKVDERDYSIALASAQARYAEVQATIEIERGRSEIAQLEWSTWQENQEQAQSPSALALREPQQAEAEAKRKGILAEINRAKLALERTSVRAPWPASVVAANAVKGQVLSAGESVGTLFPIDYGVVELQVPIGTLRLLETGTEQVSLRSVDDPTNSIVLGEFERVVKTLTDETKLATVRVRVDQPLNHHGWAFGMHLEATIVASTNQAIAWVPSELIVSGNFLWIYRDGRAQRHQVHPISQKDALIAVEDNFNTADALILQRPIGLFDGAVVDAAGT